MKKKIKDLTLEELSKFCHKQDNCIDCPFGYGYSYECPVCELKNREDLESEVEVDE